MTTTDFIITAAIFVLFGCLICLFFIGKLRKMNKEIIEANNAHIATLIQMQKNGSETWSDQKEWLKHCSCLFLKLKRICEDENWSRQELADYFKHLADNAESELGVIQVHEIVS